MTFYSYNEFHLGDNIVHLHFLRKLAARYPKYEFHHYVHACYVNQLCEVTEDIPTIQVRSLEGFGIPSAINVWKNAPAHTEGTHYIPGFWEQHPLRNDFGGFYVAYFRQLASQMGLESPIEKPEDLLFDYQRIKNYIPNVPPGTQFQNGNPDVLVINSQPGSGQFRAYDSTDCFDPIIQALQEAGKIVITTQKSKLGTPCTADYGLSITGIGNLSLSIPTVIGIVNGPQFPTFNVWNKDTVKTRICCADIESMSGLDPDAIHVQKLDQIIPILKERKII